MRISFTASLVLAVSCLRVAHHSSCSIRAVRVPRLCMLTPAEERQQKIIELQQQKVRVTRAANEANAKYLRSKAETDARRKARATERSKSASGSSSMASSRAALESIFSLDTSSMEAEQKSDKVDDMEASARAEVEALQYRERLSDIDFQIANLSSGSDDGSAEAAVEAAARREAAAKAAAMLDEAKVMAAAAERNARHLRVEAADAIIASAAKLGQEAAALRATARERQAVADEAERAASASRAFEAPAAMRKEYQAPILDMTSLIAGLGYQSQDAQEKAFTAKLEKAAKEAAEAAQAQAQRVADAEGLFASSSKALRRLFDEADAATIAAAEAALSVEEAVDAAGRAVSEAAAGGDGAAVADCELQAKSQRELKARAADEATRAREAVLQAVVEEQAGREQATTLAARAANAAVAAADAAEAASAAAESEVARLIGAVSEEDEEEGARLRGRWVVASEPSPAAPAHSPPSTSANEAIDDADGAGAPAADAAAAGNEPPSVATASDARMATLEDTIVKLEAVGVGEEAIAPLRQELFQMKKVAEIEAEIAALRAQGGDAK